MGTEGTDTPKDAKAQGSSAGSTPQVSPKPRTGTITLAALQKELGDEKGRDEYVRLGEPFGVTTFNVREFHPPLDLNSVKAKE